MASDYTANNGIEKIGTGEQAGTWGATTNTNFDIIDRAINGVGAITLSGTTHTLTTTDGAVSDGHFKVLVFGGTLSSTNTVTIDPNNQDKLYFVVNSTSGSQSIIIKQGSGATVTVANGKTAIVYADGAGSGAAVAQIETGSDSFTEDVTMKTDDGALLTLQTSATAITDGNVLGALQFQAPNESDGSDGALVSASIVGEADATFSATVNSTDLVFKLGTDGAVAEKMRLTHEGDLEVKAADGAILKLLTGDTDIASSDVLGAVEFQAPDEGTGTDAIVAAGRIEVQSEGDFSATNNAAMIVFKTGADGDSAGTPTEKFRIESTGSCGIAADADAVNATTNFLRLGASADLKIYHESAGNNSYISNGTGHLLIRTTNSDKQVALQQNGVTKIHTTTAGVEVNGTLTATEVTATSDERLKSDIQTIDNALDKVMNMRGVSYTKQAEKGIGVIAQEIEKVLPEVVTDGEYKSVAYGNIVGVLIEAIKEQQKQIDELKKDKHGSSN